MSKGNKPNVDPKTQTQYDTSLKTAQTKSPVEEALNTQALKTINWADKGDFTNPRDGGIFVNFADPAMQRRQRELSTNAGGQGIMALGAPDPNYLASVKENEANNAAITNAAQYESDIRGGVNAARAQGGDLANLDLRRSQGVLDTAAGNWRAEVARPHQPKWYERLMGGAMQAGSAFAGSQAGSAALAGLI